MSHILFATRTTDVRGIRDVWFIRPRCWVSGTQMMVVEGKGDGLDCWSK